MPKFQRIEEGLEALKKAVWYWSQMIRTGRMKEI